MAFFILAPRWPVSGFQIGWAVSPTGGLKPDLTIWLDIDPETGRARAAHGRTPDRLERESSDFHSRVREGYASIAETEPERFKRVDASGTVEEIKEEIYRFLEELCKTRGL